MIDTERPAVAHVNGKWAKRNSAVDVFELFDCHGLNDTEKEGLLPSEFPSVS